MRPLLVIDAAGDVVLADVDSAARYRFDAAPIAGRPVAGPGPHPARTAVWSAAGNWTAWTSIAGAPDGSAELRIHDEGEQENRVLAAAVDATHLAPSPCGRFLAHRCDGPLGLELAVSDVRTGALRILERGRSLSWAWAPDSTAVVVQVDGRVALVPLDGGAAVVLAEDVAPLGVPAWMADGSVCFAAGGSVLRCGVDGRARPVAPHAGAGRFLPDPSGRRLALLDPTGSGRGLTVLDLLTGDADALSDAAVAGCSWSPQGRRLAVLERLGDGRLRWLVAGGSTPVRLAPFVPGGRWEADVLSSFEQHAASHAVWSADGRFLVAVVCDADGSESVLVQTVDGAGASTAEPGAVPGARLAWWAED